MHDPFEIQCDTETWTRKFCFVQHAITKGKKRRFQTAAASFFIFHYLKKNVEFHLIVLLRAFFFSFESC